MGEAPDLRHAGYALVGDLQTHFRCQRMALGLRQFGRGRCRLAAISGVAQFDKRSHVAHAREAAMDETIMKDQETKWPPSVDDPRHAALAHKNLCSLEGFTSAISVPLRDHKQKCDRLAGTPR